VHIQICQTIKIISLPNKPRIWYYLEVKTSSISRSHCCYLQHYPASCGQHSRVLELLEGPHSNFDKNLKALHHQLTEVGLHLYYAFEVVLCFGVMLQNSAYYAQIMLHELTQIQHFFWETSLYALVVLYQCCHDISIYWYMSWHIVILWYDINKNHYQYCIY